ncbi:MAG: Gfo/Idh/MocA family oxidoreductase [Actinomycetota bacterium]
MTIRVGVFGTSWWADTMYLPPVDAHPDAVPAAICGRRAEPAKELAERWSVPLWYTDPATMIAEAELDAVIVATSNNSHHDLALAAIDAGLHVLCEKPLAMTVAEAEIMTSRASAAGVKTMVPFTYHHMPVNRWVQRLVADGYVGRPLHVNLRYYTGFGFDEGYSWRFDPAIAGTGIIGDLGSHWIHLARWILGEDETSISAVSSTFVDRAPRPDGQPYEPLEDSVAMTVRYGSGAYGIIQTSAVCHEAGETFGQTHHLEVHGTEGTLYATCDWETVQEVRGFRPDQNRDHGMTVLPIPDDIWGTVRRDRVHDTYRDVFRTTDVMTRGWLSAIRDNTPSEPGFAEGLAVQRVLDAAAASAEQGGCPIPVVQTNQDPRGTES